MSHVVGYMFQAVGHMFQAVGHKMQGIEKSFGLAAIRKSDVYWISCLKSRLKTACLTIAEIVAIGNDDVIHEMEAHQLAGPLQLIGQVVVMLAGTQIARGMVVANGNDGSIG